MYYKRCDICGVKSGRSENGKRLFMAKFPLDEARCKLWVKAAGKKDLTSIAIEKLHMLRHVCGNHFKPKDFKKKRTQLKKNAVPSLFLPRQPLNDDDLASFPQHVAKNDVSDVEIKRSSYLTEHRYCKAPTSSQKRAHSPEPSTSREHTIPGKRRKTKAKARNQIAEKPKRSSPLEQQKPEESTADTPESTQPEDLPDVEHLAELETDGDSNHVSDSENQQEPPSWSHEKDVCRACLSTSGAWDLTGTYLTEDGESERLLDMLTLCYGIKLSNISESSPSRFLCDVCAASLRHADNFRRQVLRAETNFTEYYGPGEDEIKEEYLEFSDEDETLEKEFSCTNNSDESMEQDSSNTLINTETSRNISEPPSTVNVFHKKQTKPSVEGSTKAASQKHSMSEVSYSEKYIRVISYSANKNIKNSSANKEINIESQPAEDFENNEETSNASHCNEDLVFSDIKKSKIEQSNQNVTQPTQPEKSTNIVQTVKRDSVDLQQPVKVANPKKSVRTVHPLSKANPKTMKRKNCSDINIGESDQNVTNMETQLEKSVKQSVGSDSIDFSQSVKITLPGNKVIRFLPLSTKDAGSVVTKLGDKQMLESRVPVKVDVTKPSASLLQSPIVKKKKSGI